LLWGIFSLSLVPEKLVFDLSGNQKPADFATFEWSNIFLMLFAFPFCKIDLEGPYV
jgi:hypothetical protein